MARAGARRREKRHRRRHAAGRHVQGVELGVRRRPLPACLSVRRAPATSSSITRRRMPAGPAKPAALPLPAQRHDAGPLTTNAYGFRGPPVPFQRQPKTIRIAFIGASTTVSSHFFLPYSYPEFVGNWLTCGPPSKSSTSGSRVLNAGRESITSTDNVNVVREEVLPLKPDLLVYYEGANQFQLSTMMPGRSRSR